MRWPRLVVTRLAARLGLSVGVMIAGASAALVGLGATSAVVVVSARTSTAPASSAGSLSVSGNGPTAGAGVPTPAASPSPAEPHPGEPKPGEPQPSLPPSPPPLTPSPPATSGGPVTTAPTHRPAPVPSTGTTVETVPSDPHSEAQSLLASTPPPGALETPVILEAQQGGGPASTERANQFSVLAEAGVQANATATWVIDYGDGTTPGTLQMPPVNCRLTRNALLTDSGMAPHFYTEPGTYTITVSIGLTGCDGAAGPTATTSFSYRWTSDGGQVGLADALDWVPDPAATPPLSLLIPTGTVWMPPTADDPAGLPVPMYAYCAAPPAAGAGAQFLITCTVVSAGASTPVAASCSPYQCTVPMAAVVPQAGMAFGLPQATATFEFRETMPADVPGVTWFFTFSQGSHSCSVSPGVAAS
ncbi:MAG TPA: hypothetical protein VKY26_00985 [Actinomycetota bacterium]|nr:hypothetical protein [Actinomycetota bacterium]